MQALEHDSLGRKPDLAWAEAHIPGFKACREAAEKVKAETEESRKKYGVQHERNQ